MELVKTEKKLFLLFQGKNESLNSYTRTFKAILETAKESGIHLGQCNEMANIACATDRGDWDMLAMSANQTAKDKVKEYWMEGENCYSNLRSSPYQKLSSWAMRQRREYHNLKRGEKSTMNPRRIELLEKIGFDWSPRETKWNARVKELIEYKKLHGDCLVRRGR